MPTLKFNCIITLPNAETFNNVSNVLICCAVSNQYTANCLTIPSAKTQDELIVYIGSIFISAYGLNGVWNYTKTVNGGDNIYSIDYLIPDTNVTLAGAPTFIGLRADSLEQYSAAFFLACEECPTVDTIICPTCQEITRTACESSYSFVAGLTPSTVYYAVIENNRNKRYVQVVTTDGSGDFAIDADAPEFPIGFFIPEQYKYTIKVYLDE